MNRGEVARGGSLSFVGSSVSAILGLALTIAVARLLGDSGSGVVLQAMSVFAIVLALAKFGLDSTAIWMLPRVRLDDPAAVPSTLASMFVLALAASVAVTLVAQAVILRFWGLSEVVAQSVQAVLWFVPAGALMLVLGAALRVLGNVREYVLLGNLVLPVLRLASVIFVASALTSLPVVAASWAAPTVPVAALLGLVVVRRLRPFRNHVQGSPTSLHLGRTVRFAIPRTVSAGLEQALQWVDVLLVGMLAGPAAAGIYGAASRFVQAGLVIDSALRVVVAPKLSTLLHRDDRAGVQGLYALASAWLVLFATPLYAVLGVFSPLVLSILGPNFVAGSMALTILCVGATTTFLAGNVHSVLLMSGRSGWAAFNKSIALAINVSGNLVLVPVIGISGAAFAWALSMSVDAALAAVEVRRFVGLRFEARGVLLALAVAASTFGVPSIVASLTVGQTWVGLALAIVTGGLLFFTTCWFLRRNLYLDGLWSVFRGR